MKSFKHTGKGPKYGNFTFPSKAGFGPSSGKVKAISGYSRRAPKRVMKKAVGGIVEDNIVEAPGFSDFAKGGRVPGVSNPMSPREAMAHKRGGKVKRYADGGLAKAAKRMTGAQITKAEMNRIQSKMSGQKTGPRGTVNFNRTPKIGK